MSFDKDCRDLSIRYNLKIKRKGNKKYISLHVKISYQLVLIKKLMVLYSPEGPEEK